MDLMTLAVVVIALAVVALVIVLVPAVIQLKKTLESADGFLRDMDTSIKTLIEDEVKPMVKTLNDTMAEVEGVAKGAREGVEKVSETLDAFKDVGDTVRSINAILNKEVKGTLLNAAAYAVGVKTGVAAFVQSIKSLRKKEVG